MQEDNPGDIVSLFMVWQKISYNRGRKYWYVKIGYFITKMYFKLNSNIKALFWQIQFVEGFGGRELKKWVENGKLYLISHHVILTTTKTIGREVATPYLQSNLFWEKVWLLSYTCSALNIGQNYLTIWQVFVLTCIHTMY